MSTTAPTLSAADLPAITLDDVRAAAARIDGAIVRTPTLHSQTLSEMVGAEVWLKFENLQFTAAYKERGALNCLLSLTPEQRAKGVIGASAGNHAQGVAAAAKLLGMPAVIVMPSDAPKPKRDRTAALGAEVVVHEVERVGSRDGGERLERLRGHLGADSVAADDGNLG